MLTRMGVTVNPAAILVRNTAAVLVTANLPAYAQPGTKIDVTAAAIGDAQNLQGGLLVMTSLRGADGEVYAVGQGSVVTGGFVAGRGGNSQTLNHPTAGRIPSGAIVERTPPSAPFSSSVRLQLQRPDFTTAARIVEAVNQRFGGGARVAKAENAALVSVEVPKNYSDRPVEFIAAVESLTVDGDVRAKVVINERTGTIVAGKDVRLNQASIMHGALTIEVQRTIAVSQPNPLSNGRTAVTGQHSASAKEERAKDVALKAEATVEDLVKALMAIGSTPRDIIAILESLRVAGSLDAEIEVI
jgi:flagellar P-ring protein precursor FlgI